MSLHTSHQGIPMFESRTIKYKTMYFLSTKLVLFIAYTAAQKNTVKSKNRICPDLRHHFNYINKMSGKHQDNVKEKTFVNKKK